MNDYIPYVYLIGWTKLDKWYCGVRYKKNCTPNDLWKTYFTSSKNVKRFKLQYGDPDHIEILKEFNNKEDAYKFEQQKLKEFNVLKKSNWLNCAVGGNISSCGRIMSESAKKKLSDINKGKKLSEETKEKLRKYWSGRKRGPRSDETKQKLRDANLGKKNGPCSEETKRKISEAQKGIPRGPHSDEYKVNMSKVLKALNRNCSEETKKKISESQLGEKNHMFGKKWTVERRQKQKDSLLKKRKQL